MNRSLHLLNFLSGNKLQVPCEKIIIYGDDKLVTPPRQVIFCQCDHRFWLECWQVCTCFGMVKGYRPAIPMVRYSANMWHPITHMPARRALDSAVAELLVILVSFNGFPENIVLVLIILKLVGYTRYWLLKNETKLLVRPIHIKHLLPTSSSIGLLHSSFPSRTCIHRLFSKHQIRKRTHMTNFIQNYTVASNF